MVPRDKNKKRALVTILPFIIIFSLTFIILNLIIILLVPVDTMCFIDKVYMKVTNNRLSALQKQYVEVHVVTHLQQYSKKWDFVVFSKKMATTDFNITYQLANYKEGKDEPEWVSVFGYYMNQTSVPCRAVMLNRYVRVQNFDGHTSFADMVLFAVIVLLFVATAVSLVYVINLTIKMIRQKSHYAQYEEDETFYSPDDEMEEITTS